MTFSQVRKSQYRIKSTQINPPRYAINLNLKIGDNLGLSNALSGSFLAYCFAYFLVILQDKFDEAPVVLATSEHLRTGKEYDAALIWLEDVTKQSCKVCLREMQNFDGKHEDINVVCA